jgi:hypothetical protein
LNSEDSTRYRNVVGALQYLTLTIPDLAFLLNKICQFLHAPTSVHWGAVKRILWYVRYSCDIGLRINWSTSMLISAFLDADWTGSINEGLQGVLRFIFEITLFHGMQENKQLYLDQAPRQSINPWQMLLQR